MFKRLLTTLAVLLLCAAPALAQEAKTFAVLPFGVHGPQEYQYLSQGIQSMLTTRLTWPENFTPLDAGAVRKAATTLPADAASAEKIRQTLGVDYLVWGTLTVMGQECSLDVNTVDPTGANQPRPMQTKLSQVIPSLETVAADINALVFGRPETAKPKAVAAPMNEAMIVNETQAGTAYANPSLKYQDADTSMGRWRSQTLPFSSRGMVVCDGDGDGKTEIFILTSTEIQAYRVENNEMRPVATHSIPKSIDYLRLSCLDINKDGSTEIILAGADGKRALSTVLGLKGNRFEVIEDNIPMLLTVMNLPPTFMPTLVGQKAGKLKFLEGTVTTVVKTGGNFESGPSIALPPKGNVFNSNFLPDAEGHKIVMVNDRDRLQIYSATMNLLSTTDETYAGSSISMVKQEAPIGLRAWTDKDILMSSQYIPLRTLITNLDKDNRSEIIVSRNMSVAAQILDNYRSYPQGEMHSLYFDGLGLALQWKTRLIKGTITDYALEDIDSNGALDLVVLVNTHTGMAGTTRKRTIVVAYPLDLSGADLETQKN